MAEQPIHARRRSTSVPNGQIQELTRAFYHGWYRDLVTELPPLIDGHLRPLDAPGLGIELHSRLFRPDVRRRVTTRTDVEAGQGDDAHIRARRSAALANTSAGGCDMPDRFARATTSKLTDSRSWSPEWIKDLVMYVIATKAFTSPDGPESGTFESLRAKLPYLEELGITGIWLTGHSVSDPHHFFNIWTQYACIEPDRLDPSLGTPAQFKAMINEAHQRGIRLFLDVITHGVMASSPLVNEHPEWFRGGSWGMIDYDWDGGHTDLDDWWVAIWTNAVTEYGVDGFRLDLGIHNRPDLWARIRRNAEAAGHPIVIFEEGDSVIPGVTDFCQGPVPNRISHALTPHDLHPLLVNDLPGFYARRFGYTGDYTVEIEYDDGDRAHGDTAGNGTVHVRLDGLTVDRASARPDDRVCAIDPFLEAGVTLPQIVRADGIRDVQITVEGIDGKSIKDVVVSDDVEGRFRRRWTFRPSWWRRRVTIEDSGTGKPLAPSLDVEQCHSRALKLYLPTLNHGHMIGLSAHDNGWWEHEENPYAARGSRALFGYSLLFAPAIPLFMSGEEWDATFHPLPGLTVDTVGHKNKGKGKILLGSMLDWDELDQPRHRAMLDDIKRMHSLRRREPALATVVRGDVEPNLTSVPHESTADVPIPYMRWNGDCAIVVLANRNTDRDALIHLSIPADVLPFGTAARYSITDLWNERRTETREATELAALPYVVGPDKTPRGGVGLLKIEPAPYIDRDQG
jgi:hypothetical protein